MFAYREMLVTARSGLELRGSNAEPRSCAAFTLPSESDQLPSMPTLSTFVTTNFERSIRAYDWSFGAYGAVGTV